MILALQTCWNNIAYAVWEPGGITLAGYEEASRTRMPKEHLVAMPITSGGFLPAMLIRCGRMPKAVVFLIPRNPRPAGSTALRIQELIEQWFLKACVPVHHLRAWKVHRWATKEGAPGDWLLLEKARKKCQSPWLAQTIRWRPVGDAILAAAYLGERGIQKPWRDPRRWRVGTRRVYRPRHVYRPLTPPDARLEILL